MSEPFPAAVEQKARDFIGALTASVKVSATPKPTWTTYSLTHPSRRSSR